MKHTPGPWAIDFNGTIGHIKSVAQAHSNADHHRTPTVARYDVITHSLTEAEKKANGLLIAAAPEMYDLLMMIESHYSASLDHHPPYVCKAFEIIRKVNKGD